MERVVPDARQVEAMQKKRAGDLPCCFPPGSLASRETDCTESEIPCFLARRTEKV